MKPTKIAGVSLALGMLLSSSCSTSSSESGEDPRQKLLASWTNDIILPGYARLVKDTQSLKKAVDALCDEPSEELWQEAQAAWWAARAPWKEGQIIKFGPYRDQPLALGSKIDFWPTRPEVVEEILADDEELDQASLVSRGSPARGFPAVEQLLYSVDEDVEQAFDPDARRCQYLKVASADLYDLAQQLLSAWDPEDGNYAAELTEPGSDKMFEDLKTALSEVTNRLAFTLEDMRGEKLGRPLGEQSGGEPQPELMESRPSARSVQDLLDSLRGVELFYFGAKQPESAIGLANFLPKSPRNFNEDMLQLLDDCSARLHALEPLEDILQDDPDKVVAAQDCLLEMQTFIQVDVVNELGLTVNFNDNDGD